MNILKNIKKFKNVLLFLVIVGIILFYVLPNDTLKKDLEEISEKLKADGINFNGNTVGGHYKIPEFGNINNYHRDIECNHPSVSGRDKIGPIWNDAKSKLNKSIEDYENIYYANIGVSIVIILILSIYLYSIRFIPINDLFGKDETLITTALSAIIIILIIILLIIIGIKYNYIKEQYDNMNNIQPVSYTNFNPQKGERDPCAGLRQMGQQS